MWQADIVFSPEMNKLSRKECPAPFLDFFLGCGIVCPLWDSVPIAFLMEAPLKYFVELHTPEAVERVSALLSQLAVVENWLSGQEDTQGNNHNVCEIPEFKHMKLIYAMSKQDKRVRINYWKREETGGARLESADFLVRPKPVLQRQAGFKRAIAELKLKAARAT